MEPSINPTPSDTPPLQPVVTPPPLTPPTPLVQQPQLENQTPITPVYQPLASVSAAPTQAPIIPVATPPTALGGVPVATILPNTTPQSRWKKIIIAVVLLSMTSGAAFGMFIYRDTIKAHLPYFGDDMVLTESNFISSLMNMFKTINAAEYAFSANIFIADREKDTVSMDSKLGPTPEKIVAYKNDYKKLSLASTLFSTLQYSSYNYSSGTAIPKHPKDLNELKKKYTDSYRKYEANSSDAGNQLIDSSIVYRLTENGSNYELIVTLETDEAVLAYDEAIRNLSKKNIYVTTYTSQDAPRLDGKKIIYTKDTKKQVYIPAEMKRPILSQLGYYLKDLPQDFEIHGTTTVLSTSKENTNPDIKASLSAEGNFSDLTYKLGIDTILKDSVFYYHIKNFPALGFLGGLSTLKGKWIKVETDKATSTNYYNRDYLGQMSSDVQKNLEENKAETKKFMEAFAKSADTSSLITFVSPPVREKLNNENVTKYQFFVKRESLVAFLTAFEQETVSDPKLKENFAEYKKELDKVMASPDFKEVYDYSKANIFLTLWTRKDGMPVQMQMRFRVIPSVESKNLKDKQIEIVMTMTLSKINETIIIDTPNDAKTYKEIMGTSSERGIW